MSERSLAVRPRPAVPGPRWPDGDLTTVVLDPGDPRHGLADLREVVCRAVLDGARTLVVDVSRVDSLPSTAITALLWAQRRCRARGGTVVVRDPGRRSLEMLVRTGLRDVLDVELTGPGTAGARRDARPGGAA